MVSRITRLFGHEGEILHVVFLQSSALAVLRDQTILARVHPYKK